MPQYICPKCGSSRLSSWSLTQDKFQDDPVSSIANFIFQGGKHMLLGDLSIRAKVFDYRDKTLKKCENCQSCYLVCPGCDHLNPVNVSSLVLDKSTTQCANCRKITVFASSSTYNAEGGG
jgi:hypothetical protein